MTPTHEFNAGKYRVCLSVSSYKTNEFDIVCDSINLNTTGIIEKVKSEKSFNIYPNPASQSAIISYQLSANSLVEIKMIDLLNHEVMQLPSNRQDAGNHTILINFADLSEGIYFLQFKTGHEILTKKVVIVR